jgi:hypothetical protein
METRLDPRPSSSVKVAARLAADEAMHRTALSGALARSLPPAP